ncbi:MAG: tetratricopeptide repeat protein [Tannerella sp.]|jgi:tetratricopeptide (TPR) repeat protein|nr:tetratricopeptide repeat protein [Tannerella sp.]
MRHTLLAIGSVLCLAAGICPAGTLAGQAHQTQPETMRPSIQRKLDYFFLEGINLKNAGKLDAAYEVFKHCLELDSTSSATLFELSSFYLQTDEPERAVSYLRKAVAFQPDNFTCKLALASIFLNLGMFGEAADAYEELVRAHPGKVELNYYLAEALTRKGDIDEAIRAFDLLEEMTGMSEPLSMQKYRLYMALEQPEKAFDELKKLAAKYPDDARYLILIGDLYLERKETDRALGCYQKARAIDPESPYYTVSMANYYASIGRQDSAEAQIHSALVNEKLDVDIKVGILSRYIQQLQQSSDEMKIANSLFQPLLEQHPEEVELKLFYGTLLVHQKNLDEAHFQFQLATEMDPDNGRAWQQLLNLAFLREDAEEAVRICMKCRELFPDATEYYYYLGIAYYQQQRYQEAIDAYYDGLKIIPESNRPLRSDFYGQIGDIHYRMKQPDEAFSAYDEALKYNERNIPILNNYSYFLSLEKRDLDRAERMSAQCIKAEPNNSTYLDTYAWVFFVKGNYMLAKVYIENALRNDTTNSPELLDHYGDILYVTGEREKGLEQWEKAKAAGKNTQTLERKIAEKTYLETPKDEQ